MTDYTDPWDPTVPPVWPQIDVPDDDENTEGGASDGE